MNKVKEDIMLIGKILDRADELAVLPDTRINHMMDVSAANQFFNMDLGRWLNSDDANFMHDFSGIYANIDRSAGIEHPKFDNCFLPRFSVNEVINEDE